MKHMTQTTINEILRLNKSNLTQDKISQITGYSQQSIGRLLRKHGVSNTNRKFRKHQINENYFDNWSHDMAYILGFLTADGSVDDHTLSFGIGEKDIEILNFIKSKLGDVPIEIKYNGKNKCARIRFNSVKLIDSLKKYNIESNKTHRLNIDFNIPKKYINDYIRGFFDGDGWVYIHPSGGLSFGMTSVSETFMKTLHKLMGEIGKIRFRSYKNDPVRVPQFYIEGYKKYSVPFGKLIYSNNRFALKRKKDKFLPFINLTK